MLIQATIKELNLKCPVHLCALFQHLHDDFGEFIVLRGHQHLPFCYTNDIDVFIPVEKLSKFYIVLASFSGAFCKLKILTSRLGLIKCELKLGNELIHLDILYGFFYGGLTYEDATLLTLHSLSHESGLFRVPCLSSEIRVSLLKEILHNCRVRKDKATYLLEMISHCKDDIPVQFFSSSDIESIALATVEGRYYLPVLSTLVRVKLLIYNILNDTAGTIKNVILFFNIKYIKKNEFHWEIFLK